MIKLEFDDLSQTLSTLRHFEKNFVTKVLSGDAKGSDVVSYELFESLYKLRHDSAHWIICKSRDLEFGEKPVNSLGLNISNHKYYKEVEKQTPDIMNVRGKIIHITEISISTAKSKELEKYSKYNTLVTVLKESGYEVNLEVIIIRPMFGHNDRDSLRHTHKLTDRAIDQIFEIVTNVDKVIREVTTTPLGQEWYLRFTKQILDDVKIDVDMNSIINLFINSPNKPFNSIDDLISVLNEQTGDELDYKDESFMEDVLRKAEVIDSKLSKSDDVIKATDKLLDHHKKFQTTYKNKSFLPLPFVTTEIVDSSIRSTWTDDSKFTQLKAYMRESEDPVLQELDTMETPIERVKLSKEAEYVSSLDGPNRKKFIAKASVDHINSQDKNKNIWFGLDNASQHESIKELSYFLSRRRKLEDLKNPSDLPGAGWHYLRFCQSIYREVALNAMRKERRKKFIVKPTGVNGVYITIYPGAKLRTGESLSIIWFKVIVIKDQIIFRDMYRHWGFKRLNVTNELYVSKWLSIDANRLDHYLRCYDRVMMAYFSYLSAGSDDIISAYNSDKSNTLGMIIMIYMEDRRATSKMLQDVRYVIMASVSMFRYWDDICDKFTDPIRSPLQAYLLESVIKFMREQRYSKTDFYTNIKFGRLSDDQMDEFAGEKFAGSYFTLPRILTDGPDINFKQILCEMYFTMLFNKNQDDPTHASFQILSKMLEGESNLNKVKTTTQLHTGLNKSPIDDMHELIDNPKKNQFSRMAIMIGSKLQSNHRSNIRPSGLSHRVAAQNVFLNKTLDEFATYKSSSVLRNVVYTPGYVKPELEPEDEFDNKRSDDEKKAIMGKQLESYNRQNPRRRCIEGVMELLNEGKWRAFDLIDYIHEDLYFQVFKKNQIGGVREILILDIKKRILINVLESFSRLICKDDEREMLTHGDKKFSILVNTIKELKRLPGKKLLMNYNFDKTKWGPSFMPIQFLYMFVPFKNHYPSLFRFICYMLIKHTNKKCLIPEKLVKAWLNDVNNELKHNHDPNLQKLKEKFLEDKLMYFDNESNMGQGILHYTSSYLHLCALSFRDYLLERLFLKHSLGKPEVRDILSSDDSYTCQLLPLDSRPKILKRISLLLRAQEVTERLFNMWTSRSKSSISLLIYEFNSLFGSNLTTFPTTFKFALASVVPQNTDSFFRMVKEYYNNIRQLFENAGSLELCMLAHKLNKNYCESIYHTH